jgi:hypothetical protein
MQEQPGIARRWRQASSTAGCHAAGSPHTGWMAIACIWLWHGSQSQKATCTASYNIVPLPALPSLWFARQVGLFMGAADGALCARAASCCLAPHACSVLTRKVHAPRTGSLLQKQLCPANGSVAARPPRTSKTRHLMDPARRLALALQLAVRKPPRRMLPGAAMSICSRPINNLWFGRGVGAKAMWGSARRFDRVALRARAQLSSLTMFPPPQLSWSRCNTACV